MSSISPIPNTYLLSVGAIIKENSDVLLGVPEKDVQAFIRMICSAERVFIIGVGRVFLSLQCMGKRLAHLGVDVQVVGGLTEKAISSKDILLVASGSGESVIPVEIATKAKKFGVSCALITSSGSSKLRSLADLVIELKTPTKTNMNDGVSSVQVMSTLFDQALHLFGDAVAMQMLSNSTLTSGHLWQYHANLE